MKKILFTTAKDHCLIKGVGLGTILGWIWPSKSLGKYLKSGSFLSFCGALPKCTEEMKQLKTKHPFPPAEDSSEQTSSQLDLATMVKKILSSQSLLLTTHKQCDGDGLGAQLALYHALKKMGKEVRVLCVDAVPKKYQFLQPEKHLETFEGPHRSIQPTDLALIFDTNDQRLVEPLFSQLLKTCKEVLFIDHHPLLNLGPLPTVNSWIDTSAASTGEMAFKIIKALNVELDRDIAEALYTSIAFDTQLFRFVKNSATSHLICAELMPHVHEPEEIHRHLFATHSIEKVAFLAKVLGDIEYHGEGRIAVLKLQAQDLLDHGMDMDDSRDIIDMIMNIQSLEGAALFREDNPDKYKLSLRSKGQLEVLAVAEAFGGGGHRFAAGAPMKGPYSELKTQVVDQLLKQLKSLPLDSTHANDTAKNGKK